LLQQQQGGQGRQRETHYLHTRSMPNGNKTRHNMPSRPDAHSGKFAIHNFFVDPDSMKTRP
jgi:hypothetical protein